jgi:uncharacterized protein (TIGR03083 family)
LVKSWDVASDLPPIDVTDLIVSERLALLELLGEVEPGRWRGPTVCPGWNVHDIGLHLLGNDVSRLSSRRDRWSHLLPGSEFRALVAEINERNAAWVSAARRISPRLLVELLTVTGDRLAEHYRELDPLAEGVPVAWTGDGPSPNWLDIAREYTEGWVHQQQIREAVERPGLTEPEWLRPVLETFARALPKTYEEVEAPVGATVHVAVEGPAGGRWALRRTEERWKLSTEAGTPDAEVVMPEATAWRLCSRVIGPDRARAQIRVLGERSLAEPATTILAVMV